MTTRTRAKTLGFQFACFLHNCEPVLPLHDPDQAPPHFSSSPLPSTTLCGNFFSLRNSCIQKENELNYEDDWRGKRYDLCLDPRCDVVQSWSLQKVVGLDESMREEPLYGNSACRRRGRKQIPLFLHCVEDLSGRWLSASQGGPEGPEDPNLRRVRTDLRTSISNPASATCLSLQQCRLQKTIVTS